MIGIITAMDIETEAFLKRMTHVCEKKVAGVSYYQGSIGEQELVLGKSGIGKVKCAYHTTHMVEHFQPELLINVGVAGSLSAEIGLLSMVVGTQICQHDMIVPGWPRGFHQEKSCVSTSDALLRVARQVKVDFPVYFGPIASGDTFIQREDALRLLRDCPGACCAEMEAGSLAEVARLSATPFIVFRAISDETLQENNSMQFEDIAPQAAERSAFFAQSFLEVYRGKLV